MTGHKVGFMLAAAIIWLALLSPADAQTEAPPLTEQLERANETQGGDSPHLEGDAGLDDYLVYALRASPSLEVARQRWQADLERARGATVLPDPRVSYSYFLRQVETRVGPQRQKAGLSQSFPWFGVRRLRGEVASAQAAAALQEYEQAKLRLYSQVVAAYSEYYYLGRAVAVAREHVLLIAHLEEVARARYATGAAPYSAVIQAQVELARLHDRVRSLEDGRRPAVARLNAALNRPAGEGLPWPESLDLPDATVTDEAAVAWLAEASPELRRLDELARKAATAEALAAKSSYPGITLGLEYVDTGKPVTPGMADAGKDPVMAMVAASVPIWRGAYRSQVAAARLEHAAVKARRRDLANQLQASLQQALFHVRDAERQMKLYRDTLVPLAEQSLKVALQAFESGRASFLSLIDAQRLLLELELKSERALADRGKGLGQVSALVNRDLISGSAPAPTGNELEE